MRRRNKTRIEEEYEPKMGEEPYLKAAGIHHQNSPETQTTGDNHKTTTKPPNTHDPASSLFACNHHHPAPLPSPSPELHTIATTSHREQPPHSPKLKTPVTTTVLPRTTQTSPRNRHQTNPKTP